MQNKIVVLVLLCMMSACVKPAVTAKEQSTTPVERMYDVTPNQAYYALRWALASAGYPVGQEDLSNGVISTSWVPTSPSSHYLNPFDRSDPDARDFVNLSGYYKIDFQVVPEGGKTRVVAISRVRVVVAAVKSTGAQETLVLNKVGDYLRTQDPDVTNLGVKE